jgi:AcrR family transcriptional regulator
MTHAGSAWLKSAEILRAARPIPLRDGLGGTTLDRVAAEGKISKMTLYRHFPSKEALFAGLVTAMCEYMREGLENAPSANVDKPAAKDSRMSYVPSATDRTIARIRRSACQQDEASRRRGRGNGVRRCVPARGSWHR